MDNLRHTLEKLKLSKRYVYYAIQFAANIRTGEMKADNFKQQLYVQPWKLRLKEHMETRDTFSDTRKTSIIQNKYLLAVKVYTGRGRVD